MRGRRHLSRASKCVATVSHFIPDRPQQTGSDALWIATSKSTSKECAGAAGVTAQVEGRVVDVPMQRMRRVALPGRSARDFRRPALQFIAPGLNAVKGTMDISSGNDSHLLVSTRHVWQGQLVRDSSQHAVTCT